MTAHISFLAGLHKDISAVYDLASWGSWQFAILLATIGKDLLATLGIQFTPPKS